MSTIQEVDRIESKHWHNRLITFCKNKIKRLIHPPASIKISVLVDDLTKHCPKAPQKVLSALKLHTGRGIKLHQSQDGKLAFTDGKVAISTKTMGAVVKSIKQSGVETAYEYLRKGKKLPEGYLQQIILPHIHETVRHAIQYEKTSQLPVIQQQLQGRQQYRKNPEAYIKELFKKVGIEDESSFNFERMLELKKELRNNIALSIEEQESAVHEKAQNPNNATANHRLPEPKKTGHFIEKDDRKHIQKLASGERFFSKIHLKDIGNRIKRTLLRNKRNQIIIFFGLIAGAILSAIFPPAGLAIGIAVAVGLATDIGYLTFWSTGTALWRRVRLIRGLKQIKKYADVDYTKFDTEDIKEGDSEEVKAHKKRMRALADKKRKDLAQKLLYRCKHKTFTQIYNAYAELEKQAEKLRKMAEADQKTLADSIAFEKEKSLYRERRKKLKSNLFFFDKLIENVVISRAILENRHIKDLEALWNEKFEKMNPITRQALFKKISRNKKLIIHSQQIKTRDGEWMHHIIPNWMNQNRKTEDQSTGDQSAIEKTKLSTAFKSAGVMKEMAQAFFFKQIKKTIFGNLVNLFQTAARSARTTVHVTPVAPKVTLDSGLCFIVFFLAEIAADHKNTKINEKRMEKIVNKDPGYTRQLFGKRLRTGREEIGTLRSLAKEQVEPMVDHMFESIKSMEKIGAILEDTKKQSKIRGKGQFGTMSDEEAAILILKHAAWQQLLDKEINGAFSNFHKIIQEKASDRNNDVAKTLIAKSKYTVSELSDSQSQKHIPNTVQLRGVSNQQQARDSFQQLQSEIFLRNIRDRASGQLISKFRKGEISDARALQEIGALNNLDELLALQFWIDTALKEGSYQQNEDTLKKFYRFINYIITNKYNNPTHPQHQTGSQRPIDPL
ncbi:hypothetical protein [Endozoicomonas elysicola]|nr:hypothetical protein [Endozoicomonas elysicola]